MPARLTVLASGSSGNASLLEADGFGLLIDCGLGPRVLADRLAAAGRCWKAVSAVLLTHTHRDHWNALTFQHLRRLGVPVVAHNRHHDALSGYADHDPLRKAGLVREFAEGEWLTLAPALRCLPVAVPHDSDPTFAFRFETDGAALGFASDLGRATPDLLAAFAGVDVLAIEYNHDVGMQRASRRPQLLINRVLGDHGHLSNVQAADVTRALARSAGPGGLGAVVQLHLSRECNRPELAARAGQTALTADAPSAVVVTATQFEVAAPVALERSPRRASRPVRVPVLPLAKVQQSLPGM